MKKILSILFVGTLALGGCLKDKDYDDRSTQSTRPGGNQDVIEVGIDATSTANFRIRVLGNIGHDTTFALFPVTLASGAPAKEDIRVTLVQDDNLVDEYNDREGTSFQVPNGMFSVENTGGVVVIPKGSNTGYLRITLTPADYIGGEWAIPFKIASITPGGYTISGNLNYGIMRIAIRNDYDGQYNTTGFFSHPTLPRSYTDVKRLSTVNANTVQMELGDLGPGALVNVMINPDNSVTITAGAGSNPATANIPGDPVFNNTYDPATRTFRLKYGYPANRVITETLVRL